MRKVISPLIILVLLLGSLTVSGCKDFKWEDAAKRLAVEWIKSEVITAIDKYSDAGKEDAIKWVELALDKAAANSWTLKKGLSFIDARGLIEFAWDYYIDEKLYEMAKANGMDVDAEPAEPYAWHVQSGDFPELTDLMLDKL